MTAVRFGAALIVLGAALIVAGALHWANEDLLHIGGVGAIVFGAVGVSIATETRDNR
jgi:hypothetical protein